MGKKNRKHDFPYEDDPWEEIHDGYPFQVCRQCGMVREPEDIGTLPPCTGGGRKKSRARETPQKR